jgi:hypothetical protein
MPASRSATFKRRPRMPTRAPNALRPGPSLPGPARHLHRRRLPRRCGQIKPRIVGRCGPLRPPAVGVTRTEASIGARLGSRAKRARRDRQVRPLAHPAPQPKTDFAIGLIVLEPDHPRFQADAPLAKSRHTVRPLAWRDSQRRRARSDGYGAEEIIFVFAKRSGLPIESRSEATRNGGYRDSSRSPNARD